jgi:hypothetical protein
MEPRIVLKHHNSTKSGEVESYPLADLHELTVGRDPMSSVRFDNERDDLVSRRHLKIVLERLDPPEFAIHDLGSRNGTFLNKQRVVGKATLRPGDVVQVGAGGPEFEFGLMVDPETRETPVRLTEVAEPEPPPAQPEAVAVSESVAERPPRNRKSLALAAAAAVLLGILGGVGFAAWRYWVPALNALKDQYAEWTSRKKEEANLSPGEITRRNRESVVLIETGWKLVETSGGRQLYQVYAPNQTTDKAGNAVPLVAGAGQSLPVFVLIGANQIEPALTTDAASGSPRAIGGRSNGSGFVANGEGELVTVRRVAAPWQMPYRWPEEDIAGILMYFGERDALKQTVISAAQFPKWTPNRARLILQGGFENMMDQTRSSPKVEGKTVGIDVIFPALSIRERATPLRGPDETGIAFLKLSSPRALSASGAAGSFRVGEEAVAIGFAGPGSEASTAAGRLERAKHQFWEPQEDGTFKLSTTPPVALPAGAPVFDRQGRLIAVCDSDPEAGDAPWVLPLSG